MKTIPFKPSSAIRQAGLLLLPALILLMSTTAVAGNLIYRAQLPEQELRFIPPAVLVGFNPQPEPPARLLMAGDLSSPDPRVVFSGLEEDQLELLIGVGGGQQRLARLTLVGSSCGVRSSYVVFPMFRDVVIPDACQGSFRLMARFTDRSTMFLDVDIKASRGDLVIPPGSLVGFNPQPEPPAVPSFGIRINGLAEMGSDSLTVDVSLSDEFGQAISLR